MPEVSAPAAPPAATDSLAVRGLQVRFGGLLALDGLDLDVPAGRITSLIGPNGAGKTTAFNVCSGLQRPSAGRVHLFGTDVTRSSPQARARLGLGRTFQRMELFESATVLENVALGREAGIAGSTPWRQLVATRSERDRIRAEASRAVEMCGITSLADKLPGSLSTGQCRLVELARVIAGGFRILLLDEPSSGLDKSETARFGDILTELVERTGCGILLVEHDVSLVMSVSQHIYVLDFGKPIFEGSPAEVQASPIVKAAYLGVDNEAA